ncbi:MAG: NAD-dependent epimerase/dehydratase family protein [Phycisphaerales bacterium]|nr:NAD-dependent epimerase/dehydratase family protein [Phycisphaerales bacterium]
MAADLFKVDSIKDVAQLEDMLSTPTQGAIDSVGKAKGDWIVLGVGGKLGPAIAHMLKRCVDAAGTKAKVYGVDKVYSPTMEKDLKSWGIETLTCDMLDTAALAKLPDAANVIFLAGMKFGATGNEALTWAMNVYLPAIVAQRFKNSRIVVMSSGNAYGMRNILTGGSQEQMPLNPNGDYAMSCMGRERMFQHFSIANKTPTTIIRLNYAVELRYGVLIDLATRIMADKEIDLSTGVVNVIWQGDVSAMVIQCFDIAATPATPINFAGPELLNVRQVCEQLGQLLGKTVRFAGAESPTAFVNNSMQSQYLWGYPRVDAGRLVRWTADWIKRGCPLHGKPTHFATRDGKY